ncbi:hypothetical protein [Streptomyces sp. NEAU-174]|uniref:hypothetical protein n=1 Tax=Streptomyces sp. NEAU-174 TaxID=3458254 RepID=UPI004043A9A6
MSSSRQSGRPVVAVASHVRFRGLRWQVVALAGQCVHLAGEDGSDEAVLAGHLFTDPGFALLGAEAQQPQAVPGTSMARRKNVRGDVDPGRLCTTQG